MRRARRRRCRKFGGRKRNGRRGGLRRGNGRDRTFTSRFTRLFTGQFTGEQERGAPPRSYWSKYCDLNVKGARRDGPPRAAGRGGDCIVDAAAVGMESLAREMEGVIGRVRGVAAARVVLSEAGDVETIHVLAHGTRPVEQVAADVGAVCEALFNAHVEPRRLRVSTLDQPVEVSADGEVRLELHSVTVESSRRGCRVAVKLLAGDELYEGEALGADVVDLRPKLAAEAALAAVAQFQDESMGERGQQSAWTLYDLYEVTVGPRRAVLAALVRRLRQSGRTDERWVVGCALVEKDVPDAAVRAVLDAVGRRLGDDSDA